MFAQRRQGVQGEYFLSICLRSCSGFLCDNVSTFWFLHSSGVEMGKSKFLSGRFTAAVTGGPFGLFCLLESCSHLLLIPPQVQSTDGDTLCGSFLWLALQRAGFLLLSSNKYLGLTQ